MEKRQGSCVIQHSNNELNIILPSFIQVGLTDESHSGESHSGESNSGESNSDESYSGESFW